MPQVKSDSLRWHLKLIFIYYASYADRNNYKFLKMQNYRRFLVDSQAVKEEHEFPIYDIAFRKFNNAAINYQTFLELIPNVAQIVYRGQQRAKAFQKYMNINLEGLYGQLLAQSQFGNDIGIVFSCKLDPSAADLLENCVPLRKSYEQYIISTAMHQKDPDLTFDKLYIFLKDFQVSPHLLYKSICYVIFLVVVHQRGENKFLYEDFKKMIVFIAEAVYRKDVGEELNQRAKIIKLLERMELSSGFNKMVLKCQIENSQTISFLRHIPYEQTEKCIDVLNRSIEKVWPASSRHKNCGTVALGTKTQRKENFETVRSLLTEQGQQQFHITKDLKNLKIVFSQLCSQGEVANIKTLKSIKIKKLFERMGILKTITQGWMDLTITELCRRSPTGKIQFSQFIELLAITAEKLDTSIENLSQFLISYHNTHDLRHSKIVSYRSQSPQSKLVKEMVNYIEKPLERIFNYYSKSKKEMGFTDLTKLMYDFQIFPSIVGKGKLYQIFLQSAEQIEGKTELNKLVQEKKINMSAFQNILIQVSNEICDKQLNPQQKIIILLQKMHESAGHKKILLGKGLTLVSELRSKYASVYKTNFKASKNVKHVQDFDELMQCYTEP